MNRRLVVSSLVCAAIAIACAPRNRATAADSDPARPRVVNGDFATALDAGRRGDDATFRLEVAYDGAKMTELRFPSGKTYDMVVLDERDREVWRWSDGRLYTQSLQTKQLQRGDVAAFDATWKNAPAGRYTVVATLNSDSHPQEVRRAIVLP
jgi:hypothetical protein